MISDNIGGTTVGILAAKCTEYLDWPGSGGYKISFQNHERPNSNPDGTPWQLLNLRDDLG